MQAREGGVESAFTLSVKHTRTLPDEAATFAHASHSMTYKPARASGLRALVRPPVNIPFRFGCLQRVIRAVPALTCP